MGIGRAPLCTPSWGSAYIAPWEPELTYYFLLLLLLLLLLLMPHLDRDLVAVGVGDIVTVLVRHLGIRMINKVLSRRHLDWVLDWDVLTMLLEDTEIIYF